LPRRAADEPFSSTIKKLEDLPSGGGHVVDGLAGANLRIFCRLQKIEAAYSDSGLG